jgi:hypothetical protein
MEENINKSIIKDTAEAVKSLVETEPIKNLLGPISEQSGRALGTIGKAINAALIPLELLTWRAEKIREFILYEVAEKLHDVPEEQIVTPSPQILLPSLNALQYCGTNPDLKEMFAELLANAMNITHASSVHPTHVEALRQMSPVDAHLFRWIASNNTVTRVEAEWRLNSNTIWEPSIVPSEFLNLSIETLIEYTLGLNHLGVINYNRNAFSTRSGSILRQGDKRFVQLVPEIINGSLDHEAVTLVHLNFFLTPFGKNLWDICH